MRIKLPSSISNAKPDPIALAHCRAGGETGDLPFAIGISERRVEDYVDWFKDKIAPRVPDRRCPILIPETSPTSCISLERALNLRLAPREFRAGDRRFETNSFGYPELTRAPLASSHGLVNTAPALGSRRVRDMGRTIANHGIRAYAGPVWATNHYRSISDIAMHGLLGPSPQEVLPACPIHDWLGCEKGSKVLVANYLKLLRGLVAGKLGRIVDAWLPTFSYVATYD